ncbi:VOC family protein [Vibrio anguillarum]|uniref:VOC family protein n=2 Tax=Vibrio anguillarum TaxID=55601 RepID=UPI002680DE79
MKMNHVGIMVGDMDKAVEFYTQALGLKIVMNNTQVIEERESAIGRMCIAVFGEGFKGFNIAHLVTTEYAPHNPTGRFNFSVRRSKAEES